MTEASLVRAPQPAVRLLVSALWLGIVTGLVEGLGLYVFHQTRLLRGQLTFLGSSVEIVWVAMVIDLLLFGLVGILLWALGNVHPALRSTKFHTFVLLVLMCVDWLSILLIGRINILALMVLAIGVAFQLTRLLFRYERAVFAFMRRTALIVVAIGALVFIGIQGWAWAQERRAVAKVTEMKKDQPSILVIVVDTLRADHLSGFGYDRATSPNIDLLMAQGVAFRAAFSTSSWTQPAHASMLTGRYTYEHGADDYRVLDDTYQMLGEVLQESGYRTAAFSANVEAFNRQLGFGRGFHHFEDHFSTFGNMLANTLYGRAVEYYLLYKALGIETELGRVKAPDINEATLDWINSQPDTPFFVFLNYFDVHDPYLPPESYRTMFSQVLDPGGRINYHVQRIYPPLTEAELQGEVDAYDGAIAYVDYQVDQLLIGLEERGWLEDTIIIVTSDHGESFGEHGLLQHGNALYREVVHIPLIFWWPEQIPDGVEISTPVSLTSLPATLLDLIGEQPEPEEFPLPSLKTLWENPEVEPDWPIPIMELPQFERAPLENPSAHGAMKSAVTGDWQYISHEVLGEELYRWREDLAEGENQVSSFEGREVAEKLKSYLEALLGDLPWLTAGS